MAGKDLQAHFQILSRIHEESFFRSFLTRISTFEGGSWKPDRYNNYEPAKYPFDSQNLDKPVQLWLQGGIGFKLKRINKPRYELDFWGEQPDQLVKNQFYLDCESSFLRLRVGINSFINFMNELYEIFRPAYGFSTLRADYHAKNRIVQRRADGVTIEKWVGRDLSKSLPGIYWANWFGPHCVNYFGSEKFKTAPCRRKPLRDGGYMLLAFENPVDFAKPEAKQKERELIKHLGEDAFFDIQHPDRVSCSPWKV